MTMFSPAPRNMRRIMVDQLVAAVAGNDTVGRDVQVTRQGFPQLPLVRVGVVVVVLEAAQGLDHFRGDGPKGFSLPLSRITFFRGECRPAGP